MAYSMTGIGRASGEVGKPPVRFDVEIKSYNHRFLDISVKVPGVLSPFEDEIKKIVQGRITRGHAIVTVMVNRELLGTKFEVDSTLLNAYLSLAGGLKKYKKVKGAIDINTLLSIPGLVKVSPGQADTGKIFSAFKPILKRAIDAFLKMKKQEGDKTVSDIKKSLAAVERHIRLIGELIPVRNEAFKDHLNEIQKQFSGGAGFDRDRFYQELLYVSDRTDVTEENERLNGHLKMFHEALARDPRPGRRLNFLLQEMQREANTLSVKANYLKISESVVTIKEEIEKIREQVQNIE